MSKNEGNGNTSAPHSNASLAHPQATQTIEVGPNDFAPASSRLGIASPIRLKSAVSGVTAQVYTAQNGHLIQAFTAGEPPYSAPPDGQTYSLAAAISGTVILSLDPSSAELESRRLAAGAEKGIVLDLKGDNGSINIG